MSAIKEVEIFRKNQRRPFIFTKNNVEEIINIQPKNSKAKSYQVKQIRNLIVKYRLGDSDVN